MTEREKLRLAQERSQSQWKKAAEEKAKAVRDQKSAQAAANINQVVTPASVKRAADTKSASVAARLDQGNYAENKGMQEHLALQKNIEAAKQEIGQYHNLISSYNNLNMVEEVYRSQQRLEDANSRLKKLVEDSRISTQKIQQDRKNRQNQYYEALVGKHDFNSYSAKGAAIKNPTYEDALGEETITGKFKKGNPIGNIVTFSQENTDAIRNREAAAGLPGNVSYTYLDEHETDIYNYLLAKDLENETHGAEQYLSFMQEELNRKEGEETSRRISETDNAFLRNVWRIASGLGAGYDQAERGFAQLGQEKALPQSAMQFGSYYIRKDLEDVGPRIPFLDASLGQLAYDYAYATGYSAPAVLLTAASPVAGAAMLGLSSYGNNYGNVLREGYTEEDAKRYAKGSALAETALSMAVSLGAKLGKKGLDQTKLIQKADDAKFGRMLMATNGHALANAVEEYLQEQADPALRNLFLGEKNKVDLLSPDALRAAVLSEARNLTHQRVSEAEFRDRDGEFWRNIAPGEKEEQAAVRANAHQEMVQHGQVVKITDKTAHMVQEFYPDLRDQSRAERSVILTKKQAELKEKVQESLRELQKRPLNMEVNGKLLRVELYEKGIQKATKDLTAKKAAVLLQLDDVLKNARYLYSTPDHNRNSNIYRRNHFCTLTQIGNERYEVQIVVRDMEKKHESHIDYLEIKHDATLGGGGDGKSAGRSGASSVASKNSIPNFLTNVNGNSKKNRYAWQVPVWPAGDLTAVVQAQAELLRQAYTESLRTQQEEELDRAFLRGFNLEK